MKTNANEPMYPQPLAPNGQCQTSVDMPHIEGQGNLIGLSKREYFAAMAMQGMLINGAQTENGGLTRHPTNLAALAVNQSDALIEALNK